MRLSSLLLGLGAAYAVSGVVVGIKNYLDFKKELDAAGDEHPPIPPATHFLEAAVLWPKTLKEMA